MQRGTPRRVVKTLACAGGVTAAVTLGIVTSAHSAVLADFPDFSDVSNLKLNGDAQQNGSVLQLTSADTGQTGTAFTKKAVLNKKKSFKTEFSFSMDDAPSVPADGMAFIVHSSGKGAIGDGGGGLGFGSIGDSVVVEFDTFDNDDGGSSDQANEVAIIQNGKAGKVKESSVPSFGLYGDPRWAWITYKARTQQLKVYVSDTSTKPGSPEVQAKVNLKKLLSHGSMKRAGFTAATGGFSEVHSVLSWKLSQ